MNNIANMTAFPQTLISKPDTSLLINTPGGACGVMVIVVGNGHDDTSINPGRD